MDWITGDALADIVYPLLATAAALTSILALSWHYAPVKPPRKKHPLNLWIGTVSGLLVIPALFASAATGAAPSVRIDDIRVALRLSWLLVAMGYIGIVSYYVRRFYGAICKKGQEC